MNQIGAAENYRASLTGEPFLFNETRTLAGSLAKGEPIGSLQARNQKENIIMHKKDASLKRVSPAIFRRLKVMSPGAIGLMAGTDLGSSRLMLVVAIAKTDRIVRDFLLNVYKDKLDMQASKIDRSDIEKYFESIYEEEPFIRERSEQTKDKLKQQLMKIMAEAGLVKKQGSVFEVTRPHITSRLANQLIADGDSEYLRALGGAS